MKLDKINFNIIVIQYYSIGIFYKAFKKYKELPSMKFCILVGHGKSDSGGYDPGAVNGQYHEFKIAKEIAKVASERLKSAYGADCGLLNYDGKYNLPERIKKFSDNTYDFIAEIHLNAGSNTASGTEVYYFPGDSKGLKYASNISQKISTALKIPNRGAKASDYFGIIRETAPTAVLVETCFIVKDIGKVNTTDGQTIAGNAIADGIAKAAGLNLVSTPNGWVKSGSHWYWYDNGRLAKNTWRKSKDWWYYLGADGKMLTGLVEVNGKGYYLNQTAKTVGGIYVPEGACIITDSSGAIKK